MTIAQDDSAQAIADRLVRYDLNECFGFVEVNTDFGLAGTGQFVAVRWEAELDPDLDGRALRVAQAGVMLTGVTIVDLETETFERHVDWLEALGQLGYAVTSRRVGEGQMVDYRDPERD